MKIDWTNVAAIGLMGAGGLVFLGFIIAMGAKVKELTEDLVWDEVLPPLHTFKVWEGDFSIDVESTTFQKFHWILYDLDGVGVREGYSDSLEEAKEEARAAVS